MRYHMFCLVLSDMTDPRIWLFSDLVHKMTLKIANSVERLGNSVSKSPPKEAHQTRMAPARFKLSHSGASLGTFPNIHRARLIPCGNPFNTVLSGCSSRFFLTIIKSHIPPHYPLFLYMFCGFSTYVHLHPPMCLWVRLRFLTGLEQYFG